MKSLGNYFDKKKNTFNKAESIDLKIKSNLDIFFEDQFKKEGHFFYSRLEYNSKDNSLVITAQNKVLANELTLRLIDLGNSLLRENVKLSRILIR